MALFADIPEPTSVAGRIEIMTRLHASEIVAAQQYWNHYVAFRGANSIPIQEMFDTHANEEMGHAKRLLDRIQHLRGQLRNSLCDMVAMNPGGGDVQVASAPVAMLKQDLHGEQTAIAAYTEAIGLVRDVDPGTALILTEILNDEFEHASELLDVLS